MEQFVYRTKGTCSQQIQFETDGKIVQHIRFVKGCAGNTQGVAALADGMEVDRVIDLLQNIDCNGRGTSCPAQLANALKEAKKEFESNKF